MKKIKMQKYGRLSVEGELYILLRPLPFESEYYQRPNERQFYVAFYDGDFTTPYNPHVLVVSGSYHIDLLLPTDIDVEVDDDFQEQEDIPVQIDVRSIDEIMKEDESDDDFHF